MNETAILQKYETAILQKYCSRHLTMNETVILHRLQKCRRHLKSFQKKLTS